MIHEYLIKVKKEDSVNAEGDNHGINFIKKMTEINAKANINLTVHHNFSTKVNQITEKDKRYMWRCRGNCRKMAPFFGFIWLDRPPPQEPQPSELMWVNSDKCGQHIFERYSDSDSPKRWFTEWACITIFNKFISKNKIRIKCKEIYPKYFKNNSNDMDDSFVMDVSTDGNGVADYLYVNFDAKTTHFVCVDQYFPELYDTQEKERIVCMICLDTIAEKNAIQHLNGCAGLKFSLDSEETLPLLKIIKN